MFDSAGNDRYEFALGDGQDQIVDSNGTDALIFGADVSVSDVQVVFDPVEAGNGRYRLAVAGSTASVTISGVATVEFQDGTIWTAAYSNGLATTITGTSGNDVINGSTQDDRILGLAGNDQINGLAGADWLDGGPGNNTLTGGTGNDTYVVDAVGDSVVESANAGTDAVLASSSWTLGSNVENLTLTGSAAINAAGNTLNNILTGNAADNTLDGGSGNDTMLGGAGNDSYTVDSTLDVITELAGEGTDSVCSASTGLAGPTMRVMPARPVAELAMPWIA